MNATQTQLLMDTLHYIETHIWASNALKTLILLLTVILLRVTVNYFLEKKNLKSSERRLKLKIYVRNTLFALLVVGLFAIWSNELKTLALSLVAVAVALIVATKELIMCLTGTLFKLASGAFSIGDRIVVGDLRGEVIDQTILSTTLIEVGPGKEMHQQTGRSVTLPNSVFITTPLVNESFTQNYVLHGFSVPLKLTPDWKDAEARLLAAAQEVCEPFRVEASRHLTRAARKRSVDAPSVEPRVWVNVQEPEKLLLTIRIAAPVKQRGRIEQEILRKFLDSSQPSDTAPAAGSSE